MIPFQGRPDPGASSLTPYRKGPGPDRGSVNSALMNPSLSESKISLDSNVTTSIPIIVRPWQHGWEKNFNEGSLLFCHRNNTNPQVHTALDLPSLNYVLQQAVRSVGRQNFNLENNDMYPRPFADDNTPNKFGWQEPDGFKFGFFGVIRNDMMANSTLQKLFNCDVFGRTMVGNIFKGGDRIKRGDLVGLAICIMDVNSVYGFFEQPDGTRLPKIVTTGQCYQVIGTHNNLLCGYSEQPRNSFIKEENLPRGANTTGETLTVKKILRKIPLGTVSHAVGRVPSLGAIRMALRSQDKFTLLPRIEVLLNN